MAAALAGSIRSGMVPHQGHCCWKMPSEPWSVPTASCGSDSDCSIPSCMWVRSEPAAVVGVVPEARLLAGRGQRDENRAARHAQRPAGGDHRIGVRQLSGRQVSHLSATAGRTTPPGSSHPSRTPAHPESIPGTRRTAPVTRPGASRRRRLSRSPAAPRCVPCSSLASSPHVVRPRHEPSRHRGQASAGRPCRPPRRPPIPAPPAEAARPPTSRGHLRPRSCGRRRRRS